MKKKIACAVLGAMLLGLSLTACGNADNPSTGEITESGYPKREFIVAAIDSHDKTSAHESAPAAPLHSRSFTTICWAKPPTT